MQVTVWYVQHQVIYKLVNTLYKFSFLHQVIYKFVNTLYKLSFLHCVLINWMTWFRAVSETRRSVNIEGANLELGPLKISLCKYLLKATLIFCKFLELLFYVIRFFRALPTIHDSESGLYNVIQMTLFA